MRATTTGKNNCNEENGKGKKRVEGVGEEWGGGERKGAHVCVCLTCLGGLGVDLLSSQNPFFFLGCLTFQQHARSVSGTDVF